MLTFKDHTDAEHDFDSLPDSARNAIVSRGIGHLFSNEVASQVLAHIKSLIAGKDGKASAVTKAQVDGYRATHPEWATDGESYTSKVREFRDDKLASLLDGTIGTRTPGIGPDPLMREMLRLAKEEIVRVFRARKWKFPQKDEVFAAGDISLDAAGWVSRWLNESTDKQIGGPGEPNYERIESLAKANVAAAQEAAKAAAAAMATAEDLEGL